MSKTSFKQKVSTYLLSISLLCGVNGIATASQSLTYQITTKENAPPIDYKAKLPDISGFTRKAIEEKQAREKRRGQARISLQRMFLQKELKEFTAIDTLRVAEWARRQETNPKVIVIEEGHATLADITRAIKTPFFEEINPGTYISRIPILIKSNSSLTLARDTKQLRLSKERGAFIVNDGKLFVIGSNIIGWLEKTNTAAYYESKTLFRPFLAAWGGSETYIVDSSLSSLGYNKSKSYGVSFSADSSDKKGHDMPATGWLISSVFDDIYYGFYSYEAENIAIIKNIYRNNIIYGIDPHDRTSGLIIAENEVFGTRKKHGIIGSRAVNNSFIFRNHTYQNKLSGIVLDRHCENNLIADNWVYDNEGDGIGLYESSNNVFINNIVKSNKRHGFRIRNSQNIFLDGNTVLSNHMYAVYGQVKDLSHTKRDFKKDPYQAKISFSIKRGNLAYNKSGPLYTDPSEWLEIGEIKIKQKNGMLLQIKDLPSDKYARILDILYKQNKTALLQPL